MNENEQEIDNELDLVGNEILTDVVSSVDIKGIANIINEQLENVVNIDDQLKDSKIFQTILKALSEINENQLILQKQLDLMGIKITEIKKLVL